MDFGKRGSVMAVWRRGRPKELLQRSGHDVQHTREDLDGRPADQAIAYSMRRRGYRGNNAAIESVFSTPAQIRYGGVRKRFASLSGSPWKRGKTVLGVTPLSGTWCGRKFLPVKVL